MYLYTFLRSVSQNSRNCVASRPKNTHALRSTTTEATQCSVLSARPPRLLYLIPSAARVSSAAAGATICPLGLAGAPFDSFIAAIALRAWPETKFSRRLCRPLRETRIQIGLRYVGRWFFWEECPPEYTKEHSAADLRTADELRRPARSPRFNPLLDEPPVVSRTGKE